jgi:uncharacterized protein (TIGR02757 family)
MQTELLKQPLENLFRTYDLRHLSSDPLSLVHRFKRPEDRETVGLIAAVFAYGRVGQILKTLQAIVDRMDDSPYAFLLELDLKRDARRFEGIVHRFNNGTDILCLMYGMREILRTYGSLKALFLKGYSQGHPDIEKGLCRFVDHFLNLDYSPVIEHKRPPKNSGFRFLFPSPRNKSACKRLNMYLRWMVRRGDGLDLGLWEEVSPSKLIIPLDTHLFRISARLGLTRRKAADWAAAREVTQNLKLLDPSDPVKYDFALARLGILKECQKEQDLKQCKACLLYKFCSNEQAV